MEVDKEHFLLTTVEKRSIFFVLLGTFLEYFDLVLYVHLAVILNPLFLPQDNPWAASLLGVLTFSSAYLLRPLGSFVFGYIGDKKGRKASIVWTSFLMGIASCTIGLLPSYEVIGFSAAIIFILARALQGFSSIGEITGAHVFVVEVAEKNSAANFISVFSSVMMSLGSTVALGVSLLCLHFDPIHGWRIPFLMGAAVAVTGGLIRIKAIESPAFTALKERKKRPTLQETVTFLETLQVRKQNYWCYFGMEIVTPVAFYFTYRYCSELLREIGLTSSEIIFHNLPLGVLQVLGTLTLGALALRWEPFAILKVRGVIGLVMIPFLFLFLAHTQTETSIFIVQMLTALFWGLSISPALVKIVQAFPVIGRCTNLGSAYAISHAMMYVVTSYCTFFLDQAFGIWGVGGLIMGAASCSLLGIYCFRPALHRNEEDNIREKVKWTVA